MSGKKGKWRNRAGLADGWDPGRSERERGVARAGGRRRAGQAEHSGPVREKAGRRGRRAERAAEWAGVEQAGALEKEKGGGVRLGHRVGQARKGKEEEGRANS